MLKKRLHEGVDGKRLRRCRYNTKINKDIYLKITSNINMTMYGSGIALEVVAKKRDFKEDSGPSKEDRGMQLWRLSGPFQSKFTIVLFQSQSQC